MDIAKIDRAVELRNLIPYTSNFAMNRQNGTIYVDKTGSIYNLILDNEPKFLFRPRRFGKSTIVSTIKEIFEHGIEGYDGHESYFKGLEIYDLWDEKPGQYPVLHLDFSVEAASALESRVTLKHLICEQIRWAARENGINLNNTEDNFRALFESLFAAYKDPRQNFVLLIDEYDYPLTHCQEHLFEELFVVYRAFYSCLKALHWRFRCIFITGITRYTDASVFTAGNIIADYSQDATVADICGYTREEVKKYFPAHLRYAASCLLNKEEEAVTDAELEDLLDALERRYGGYAFDEDVEVRVLNPWSILNFFSDSDPYLTGYWFEGGGFPPVLKKAMIEGIVNHNKDFCTDPVLAISWEDFAQPQSYDTMAPETLLFLTGYLTLASSISMHSTVELRMPNSEIKNPYSWLVCSTLIQNPYLRVSAHDICTLQSTTEYAAFLNKILDLMPSDVCPLSSATSVSDFLLTLGNKKL